MFIAGALLGPFLDNYHGQFDTLRYSKGAFELQMQGMSILKSAYWVPFLFGVAGVLISQLYDLFDKVLDTEMTKRKPTPWKILYGISAFAAQYYLSGYLDKMGIDTPVIHLTLAVLALVGFRYFDGSKAGFVTSLATAVGGPAIEIALINLAQAYSYTNADIWGVDSWIPWVYFLGGPAVGNLGRGIANSVLKDDDDAM